MRHTRLKLVAPENSADGDTDGTDGVVRRSNACSDRSRHCCASWTTDERNRRMTRRDRFRSSMPAGPNGMGTGFVTQLVRVRVPGPAPRSCSSVGRARA